MVTSSSSDATVVSSLSRGQLIDVLQDVLKNLDQLSFPFVSALAPSAVALRDSLKVQVGDNLLPQLEDGDTPAIVVVGGSTGAGKSTLVNSILVRKSRLQVFCRPTTKTPVLVCNPEDQEVLLKHPLSQISRRLLPTSSRPAWPWWTPVIWTRYMNPTEPWQRACWRRQTYGCL